MKISTSFDKNSWTHPSVIILVGALLRFYHLGTSDLSLDEGFSYRLSAQPLHTIWGGDNYHPPLFYILLHYWRFLAGSSEFSLRLPSLVFGTLSILLIYRLGCYLLNRRMGLLSAFILAVSPFHILYSQQARMYAALFFFALLALDSLARLIQEGRISHWLLYTSSVALGNYTDYGSVFSWASHFVAIAWLLALKQRIHLLKWGLAQIAIAVLYLPWIPMLASLVSQPQETFAQGPDVSPTSVLATLPVGVRRVTWLIVTFTSEFLPARTPHVKFALILIFGLISFVGLSVVYNRRQWAAALLGSAEVIPIALGLVLSIRTKILAPRTFIAASGPYYLLLGAGFLSNPSYLRWYGRLSLVLLLFAANAVSLNIMFHSAERSWSEITKYVASTIRPDQGVAIVDGRWRWNFNHYYRGPSEVEIVGYEGPTDLGKIRALMNGHSVVFLVLANATLNDPNGQGVKLIRSRFVCGPVSEFPGGATVERCSR